MIRLLFDVGMTFMQKLGYASTKSMQTNDFKSNLLLGLI